MDETAYRQIYPRVVVRACTFEKALLSQCVACERADRIQIAEREIVGCLTEASLSRCTSLHELLRHGFAFALGKHRDHDFVSHAQELRIQCGGLDVPPT